MANETTKEKTYEKLSKSEQMVIGIVLKNLENGSGLWSPGWVSTGLPKNAITGNGIPRVQQYPTFYDRNGARMQILIDAINSKIFRRKHHMILAIPFRMC